MRMLTGTQFSTKQLKSIISTIKEKTPCKLLIFGLGNDSFFWHTLNKEGVTIFLEDNKYWLKKIKKRYEYIKVFLVDYETKKRDWEKLLENTKSLNMSLPAEVTKESWDIILVDAPAGFDDNSPGRMKSIYVSSKLIKESGDVFVHDCNRDVENIYSNTFLKKENLVSEVRGGKIYLRHYKCELSQF